MRISSLLLVGVLAAVAGPAGAKQVDVADKAYVKTVTIKSDRDEQKTPIKRMKIMTQQFNKNQSNLLQVYVEVVDAKGVKYFGEIECPQGMMRIDSWSQANWTVALYLDELDNAKVTAYVVRYLAAEKKSILDQKCDGVKSYDELGDRNKDSKPLKMKFLGYDLVGF